MTYNHTYTHSGQVRVCECVGLTQLGLFLAGMWSVLLELEWDGLHTSSRQLRLQVFDSRHRLGLWSAGEHYEAVFSCPYHLRWCALQVPIYGKVLRACVHARTHICVRACVCDCEWLVCASMCVCVARRRVYVHEPVFVRVRFCFRLLSLSVTRSLCQ